MDVCAMQGVAYHPPMRAELVDGAGVEAAVSAHRARSVDEQQPRQQPS